MPAIASEPVSVRAGDGSSLFWLSLASGSADVLSFVELGNLFTSAMTGNAALLALAIGRGQWLAALRVTCALVSFALGVSIATVYAARRVDPHAPRAFRRLLRLELAFLGGCAALGSIGSTPLGGGLLFAVIALSAVSMGIQAVGARIIDSAGISTVVFTSVLVRIVMSATGARMRRDPVPESPTGGRARSSRHVRRLRLRGNPGRGPLLGPPRHANLGSVCGGRAGHRRERVIRTVGAARRAGVSRRAGPYRSSAVRP